MNGNNFGKLKQPNAAGAEVMEFTKALAIHGVYVIWIDCEEASTMQLSMLNLLISWTMGHLSLIIKRK